MKKLFCLITIVMVLFPISVKGYFCNYNNKVRLKNIANNVMISYDYVEDNNKVVFSLTFTNLNKEIKLIDATIEKEEKEYLYSSNEIVLNGFESGKTYKFQFWAVDENCMDAALLTKYINIPTYNPFYKDDVCKNLETYSLCHKWNNHGLSYEQFLKIVTEYKKPIIIPPKNDIVNKYWYDNILNFILEYYYVFLVGIILTCSLSIYYLNKKDSFKF